MDVNSYFGFINNLVGLIPFNIFDLIVFLAFAIYVVEDASFGLIAGSISLFSTIAAFFIGLVLYPLLSGFMGKLFMLPKGISDAVSFLVIVVVSFFTLSLILSFIRKKYIKTDIPQPANAIGGGIMGGLSFFFIASFAVLLLLSFPVSEVIKSVIRDSVSGRFIFTSNRELEVSVRKVFGGAIDETINFLTIKPGSDDLISLNFKTTKYSIDKKSQEKMIELINKERQKAGLPQVYYDESLTLLAQEHAKDMLERGYFSHYTPEGFSPFDRMEQSNIEYLSAGENLAFAPDVQIAMDGLMESPGHRENILSPSFGRVGVGVLDAGIYGKMFVQEFTN